jgi:hypothetical protein
MENKISVWVNAKDRLPNMEQFLFIKDNVGCKRLGNFFTDNGIVKLSICGTEMYASFIVENEHLDHYWWLDENATIGKAVYVPVQILEIESRDDIEAMFFFNYDNELIEFDSEEDAIEELERNNVTNYKIYSRTEK